MLTWDIILSTINTLVTPALAWVGYILQRMQKDLSVIETHQQELTEKLTQVDGRLQRAEQWREDHDRHDNARFDTLFRRGEREP